MGGCSSDKYRNDPDYELVQSECELIRPSE